MGLEFKFKEVKDAPEDVLDQVIEKTGHVVEFTLRDIKEDIRINKQRKEEVEARRRIAAAAVKNIEENHAWVKDEDPQRLVTARLYVEETDTVENCDKVLEQFDEFFKDSDDQLEQIEKQIGAKIEQDEQVEEKSEGDK